MANSAKATQGILHPSAKDELVQRACKRCSGAYTRPISSRFEYCPDCRPLLKAEKARKRRAQAKAAGSTGLESWHGSMSGYSNHCCRCDSCRSAYRAYNDEWRKRPEVIEHRRVAERIRSKHPQRKLKKKAYQYGVDADTLSAYLADGICFACGTQASQLSVDHDHACCPSSRKVCGDCVRGLLCRECNQALGLVKDRREHLQSLIDYLDRWEARRASQ